MRRNGPINGVDWFKIITDLNRSGYSNAKIAKAINNVNPSTVFCWKSGSEPRYSDGTKLIAMWREKASTTSAPVPMTQCPLWLKK